MSDDNMAECHICEVTIPESKLEWSGDTALCPDCAEGCVCGDAGCHRCGSGYVT